MHYHVEQQDQSGMAQIRLLGLPAGPTIGDVLRVRVQLSCLKRWQGRATSRKP
jgi:hypothetical protein